MGFRSFRSGDDGEYNAVGLVEKSKISVKHDTFFFGIETFDWVCLTGPRSRLFGDT